MTAIELVSVDNNALIFNVDDYMTIRCEHRIVGKLVGFSKWPRNPNYPGLPAIFSPYETQLLIDKGIAQLHRKNLSTVSSETNKQQYETIRNERFQAFNDFYCDKKIDDAKRLMDKILSGKRKKLLRTGGNPDDVTEDSVLDEVRQRYKFDKDNILVQIPTQEPFDADFVHIQSMNNLNQLKYRVYRHLHDEGHWITSGETFGGDFLIYPGDPLYFHASHIIHVLSENEASSMDSKTLTTRCRMGVGVNKLCIFAFEIPQTKELCFQTIQWKGK